MVKKSKSSTYLTFISLLTLFLGLGIPEKSKGQQKTILYQPDTTRYTAYAFSVDISGSLAIVGAPGKSGEDEGIVYIYKKNDGQWKLDGELKRHKFLEGYNLGREVVTNGYEVFASEIQEDGSGAVHIWDVINDEWDAFRRKPEDQLSQQFGYELAANENSLVVGRPEGFSGAGETYFYSKLEGTFDRGKKKTPISCPEGVTCKPEDKEGFGSAVAIHSGLTAVASPQKILEDRLKGQGIVYLYEESDSGWVQNAIIEPPKKDTTVYSFGSKVTLTKDYLAVSDPKNLGGGAVYVYKRTSQGWSFDQKIIAPEVNGGDDFGWSMDVNDNNILAIGHWDSDHDSASTEQLGRYGEGFVYVYRKQQDEWLREYQLSAADAKMNSLFGYSIELNNRNQLIVGAPKNRQLSGDSVGKAFIYNLDILTDSKEPVESTPKRFMLNQNYPNPFNPTTTIKYSIPEATKVTLTVYNLLGQPVAELVNTRQQAGTYSAKFNAGQLASGVYIYKLTTESFNKSRKMMLIK